MRILGILLFIAGLVFAWLGVQATTKLSSLPSSAFAAGHNFSEGQKSRLIPKNFIKSNALYQLP